MDTKIRLLEQLYGRFNARDIDGVLASLTDDVAWANGMEGGHVHGPEAIRAYWTHQWAVIDPRVEPVGFHRRDGETVRVDVRQIVHDLKGTLLADAVVGHVFQFRGGKVARFDIEEA